MVLVASTDMDDVSDESMMPLVCSKICRAISAIEFPPCTTRGRPGDVGGFHRHGRCSKTEVRRKKVFCMGIGLTMQGKVSPRVLRIICLIQSLDGKGRSGSDGQYHTTAVGGCMRLEVLVYE